MRKLPLIVRRVIDFDVWLNRKVLGWDDERNFKSVLERAQSDVAREYIRNKFCK